MFFSIGILIVFVSVLGGYTALGGNVYVLWQPFEYVIILGAAIGAYIIAVPRTVLVRTLPALWRVIRGSAPKKEEFNDLLCLQFSIFKLANRRGMLALEQHVESPDKSTIFGYFPRIQEKKEALQFMCDYLRLLTLGSTDVHQLEALMDQEIEIRIQESERQAHAIQSMGDALPALGIVAAVLGIIKTMGALSAPPEVLGHSIGGALVGTFMGIFIAYGMVTPLAQALTTAVEDEAQYYACIKTGLVAYLNGLSPTICVEFARKSVQSSVRPSFSELEDALSALPALE